MCFSTRSNVTKSKVAEKDMYGVKALDVGLRGRLGSPVMNSYWTPKKVKTAKLKQKLDWARESISVGLHCFKSVAAAKRAGYGGYKFFRVKIPKGAHYYENGTQIVSNKMVVTSKTPIK